MNLSFINKESITRVAWGTGGALATLPMKKFVLPKVPVINKKEVYGDVALLVGGIALAAFSNNRNVKTAGFGMSLAAGFNIGKSFVQKAGIGSTQEGTPPFMSGVESAPNPVLMGSTGTGFEFGSDSYDFSSSEAGEMDF